jgi:glycerate 2-kinase
MSSRIQQGRFDAEAIYRHAMAAVAGDRLVADSLDHDGCGALGEREPVRLIAVGKAAVAMTKGALRHLSERISGGLLITRHGYAGSMISDSRLKLIEAGHPWPDHHSIRAGRALLDELATIGNQERLLLLISGGSSSLVEQPVGGIDTDRLAEINRQLVAGGLDIEKINRIRISLSTIKGGRLLDRMPAGRTLALLLSDVAGDDPATIASGLAGPPPSNPLPPLPESIAGYSRFLDTATIDSELQQRVERRVVGGNDTLVRAACTEAERLGYRVQCNLRRLDGSSSETAESIARQLKQLAAGSVLIAGGETTVKLNDTPGRGGRCQHLALQAAIALRGYPEHWLLAAASDGSDGDSHVSGAVISGTTVNDANLAEAEGALARFDSGTILSRLNALIPGGESGSNVNDLLIALRANSR